MSASPDHIPLAVLRGAVDRGVLTPAQYRALLAAAGHPDAPAPPRELDRLATSGTTAIGLAYRLGTALVLLAAGWLLSDRWEALGPPGVLGVAGGYLAVAVIASKVLGDRGSYRAAAWLATIAVALVPLVTWAALRVVGWFPERLGAADSRSDLVRILVLEAATLAASLVARRAHETVAHTILTAASLTLFVLTLVQYALLESRPDALLTSAAMVWAGVLVLIGYAADRAAAARGEPSPHPDVWYLMAAWLFAIGLAVRWQWLGPMHHPLTVAIGVALLWAAVQLGRVALARVGLGWLVLYALWLVADVFRGLVGAPAALAGVGLLVLLVAVSVQRRFPQLMARAVRWRTDAALTLPGGWATAAIPLGYALVLAVWRAAG